MPIITVITINRNNAFGLKKTLKSIENQTSKDFEFIVIDGASTDESISLLQTFQLSNLQTFKWVSEPDSGIYNAMNKAIKMATGDYFLFINSGDELANNEVIEKIHQDLLPETELASGILTLINNENTKQLYPPTEISLSYCINSGLTHPNTLIRKSLFDKYGLYNESNKIVSDWEFFLIAAGLNNCNYQQLDIQIAKFYQDGISSFNKELVNTEMQRVIKRIIPKTILKDLKKLEVLESLTSQPAYQMVQQSNLINKLLLFIYKIRKRFKAYKD